MVRDCAIVGFCLVYSFFAGASRRQGLDGVFEVRNGHGMWVHQRDVAVPAV
jgi:hypothetical protein